MGCTCIESAILAFILLFGYGYSPFNVGMHVEINSSVEFQQRQTLGSGFIKAAWQLTRCSCSATWHQSISQSWSMVVCSLHEEWFQKEGLQLHVAKEIENCTKIAICNNNDIALMLYILVQCIQIINDCMWILEWKCCTNVRLWKSIFCSSYVNIILLLATAVVFYMHTLYVVAEL